MSDQKRRKNIRKHNQCVIIAITLTFADDVNIVSNRAPAAAAAVSESWALLIGRISLARKRFARRSIELALSSCPLQHGPPQTVPAVKQQSVAEFSQVSSSLVRRGVGL